MSQLAEEPWVKALGRKERTEFMNLIHHAAIQNGKGTIAPETISWKLIGDYLRTMGKGYTPLLKSFIHELIQAKNLFTISVVFILGWTATTDVQAQQRANRINQNFNLFINATPQQLEEMQKDPIQTQVCIQGAEALLLLSGMEQQHVQGMFKEVRHDIARPTSNQSRSKIRAR